jgi:hypothetical protein
MKRCTRLFFCLCLAIAANTAQAGSRWWTGSASQFWSNSDNWDPTGVPQEGDLLILDRFSFFNTSMINDLPGLAVDGLLFNFHDFVLAGNTITVGFSSNGLRTVEAKGFESHSVTINCPLVLAGDTVFDSGNTSVSTRLRLNAEIQLNGHRMTMSVASGGRLEIAGSISGTGNVHLTRFSNVGTIEFLGTADNTFTGTMSADHFDEMPTINFNKEAGSVVAGRLELQNGIFIHTRRPHQIGDNALVCISGGSRLLFHGNTETIGNLCLTNSIGDTQPSLVDTGGATLSVLGDITAVNNATNVVAIPTIRGILGLPGP